MNEESKRNGEAAVLPIRKLALTNDCFRREIWTGPHAQVTVMRIPVGGEPERLAAFGQDLCPAGNQRGILLRHILYITVVSQKLLLQFLYPVSQDIPRIGSGSYAQRGGGADGLTRQRAGSHHPCAAESDVRDADIPSGHHQIRHIL